MYLYCSRRLFTTEKKCSRKQISNEHFKPLKICKETYHNFLKGLSLSIINFTVLCRLQSSTTVLNVWSYATKHKWKSSHEFLLKNAFFSLSCFCLSFKKFWFAQFCIVQKIHKMLTKLQRGLFFLLLYYKLYTLEWRLAGGRGT